MALEFIKTKRSAYIVNTAENSSRDQMEIIYGRAIHLYADRVITDKNPSGVMKYTDYITDNNVQVCKTTDVIERRPLTDEEQQIYDRLSSNRKLLKSNRDYLTANFYSSQSSTL